MGGCATKPKATDGHLPAENPSAPELVSKSVDLPAAAPPAPAADQVKTEAADGPGDTETEEATPDASEPKEPAAAPAGEKPGEPEANPADLAVAKDEDVPKQDSEVITGEGKQNPSEAQGENAEAQEASAGESTAEGKKSRDVVAAAERKEETVAESSSASA